MPNESVFGYQKTTDKVQLGRRLTPQFARRQLLTFIGIAIFMQLATSRWLPFQGTVGLIVILAIFPITIILCMGLAVKVTPYESEMNNLNQSLEFNDTYVEYFKNENFIQSVRFFIATACNKNDSYFHRYTYDQIESVQVLSKMRYLPIGAPIPTNVYTTDFNFQFRDGTHFYMYWPTILNGEGKMIAQILKANVANIQDTEGVLDAMERGESVHTYMENKAKEI